MESQVIFFEIDGDRQVEEIKKQILRLLITKQDLEATTNTLVEIIRLLSQPTLTIFSNQELSELAGLGTTMGLLPLLPQEFRMRIFRSITLLVD